MEPLGRQPLAFGSTFSQALRPPPRETLLGGPFDLVSRVSKVGYGGL